MPEGLESDPPLLSGEPDFVRVPPSTPTGDRVTLIFCVRPAAALCLLHQEGLRLPCSDRSFVMKGTSTAVFKLVFSN